MINKIDLQQVKVASYLRLDGLADELNKNFETLATAIQSVDAEGIVTVPGPQGDKGEQGEQGVRGPAGQDGKDGINGINGADGLPGETGAQGIQGIPGKDGKDGAPGIQGPKGEQGIQGPAGPAGVGIKGFASGYVDAGQFVTLDNLKFTVTTNGQRGLSCATVAGSVNLMISANYALCGGANGNATSGSTTYTYNTTPSGSWFGWSFPNAGDGSTYLVNDATNQRFYRVHLMIGYGYSKNFISIERLY
jgi:hypothetical protein